MEVKQNVDLYQCTALFKKQKSPRLELLTQLIISYALATQYIDSCAGLKSTAIKGNNMQV